MASGAEGPAEERGVSRRRRRSDWAIGLGLVTGWLAIACPVPATARSIAIEIAQSQACSARAQELFNDARQLYEQENYLDSFDQAQAAIATSPECGDAYFLRGYLYELAWSEVDAQANERYLIDAVADYTLALQFLDNDRDRATAYLRRGLTYSYLREFDAAEADLSQAIALDPGSPEAYYYRGFIRSENNQAQQAIVDLTKAIERDRMNQAGIAVQAYAQRGLTTSGYLGDLRSANRDFLAAVQLEARSPEAYWNRGAARLNLGDLAGAEADFTRAIEDGNYLRAYYDRAAVRYYRGNQDGARVDLEAAIAEAERRNTIDFFLNERASELLTSLGFADEALQLLDATIQADPDEALLYYSRGLIQTDRRLAEADLTRAIQLERDFAVAYYQRSLVRSQREDLQGALDDLNRALVISINYADAYLQRGILLWKLGEEAASTQDGERAIALYEETITASCADQAQSCAAAAYAFSQIGFAYLQFPDGQEQAIASFQSAADLYRNQGNEAAYQQTLQVIATLQGTAPSQDYLLYQEDRLTSSDPTLEDGSHFKVHTFAGRAGQVVTIDLVSQEFDPFLVLLDSQGTVLASNDDSGQGVLNSQIVITLPRDDQYAIVVNAYDASGLGQYTVSVR